MQISVCREGVTPGKTYANIEIFVFGEQLPSWLLFRALFIKCIIQVEHIKNRLRWLDECPTLGAFDLDIERLKDS